MSTPSKSSQNIRDTTASTSSTASTGTQLLNACCAEFKKSLSSDSSESSCRRSSKSPCRHGAHQHMEAAAFAKLLPAEHWAAHGLQHSNEASELPLDVDQAHRIINDAFVKRLQEIEQKAPNALEVKLATYKDWVAVLQRLNKVLLNDLDELEKTIEQHLNIQESRTNYGSRHDVATLVSYIRRAYHQNNWSFAGLKFETITPAEILGLNEKNPRDKEVLADFLVEKKSKPEQQRKDSHIDSIKALVDEVARKHDQIGGLKNEICLLEEEIKNAQRKIKLKDEYIRELKNSLQNSKQTGAQEVSCKCCCLNKMPQTPTVNLTESVKKGNENVCFEVAKVGDEKDASLPKLLNSTIWQNQNTFQEIRSINELYLKLDQEKTQALSRLNHLRNELLKILAPHGNVTHSLSVQFTDEMLLQATHDRFVEYQTQLHEFKKDNDRLMKEKAENAGELMFLKKHKESNEDTLRELSDLLTSMTGKICCYESIYDSSKTFNPFCEAICGLQAQASAKIGELKAQLQRETEQRETIEKEFSILKNQLQAKNAPNVNPTTDAKDTSSKSLTRPITQRCTHI